MVKKVLIIDDEKDLSEFLRLNLENTDKYEVRVVTESAKSVAVAREFQPDIIILDEIMPGLDGAAIAAILSGDKDLKKIPIIFLTAAITEEEASTHSGMIGAHAFIAKPASVSTITQRIEDILKE